MRTAQEGQRVRLKPERAEAYGFNPDQVYDVVEVYTRGNYKTPWVRLHDGYKLVGSVKVTELRGER